MNPQLLKKTTTASFDGSMIFPETIKTLIDEGVISYRVDLMQNKKAYYGSDREVVNEDFTFDGPIPAKDFNAGEVQEAIRASQAKKINYPEFLNRVLAAGCTDYTVYIQGRKAIYFGRKGEFHIENFPQ